MEVFQLEKEILKYLGIEKYLTKRMKYVTDVQKFLNNLAMFYCVFVSASYILSAKDLLDMAESLSPSTSVLVMLIKYAVFCKRSGQIFGFMDEIEEFNGLCKNIDCVFIYEMFDFNFQQTRIFQMPEKY
ncbi:hypothetical protein ACKWTF_005360 [Chironomus riparius]